MLMRLPPKVEIKIFYKYGMIYREVNHTPRVEWCGIMKDCLHPIIATPPL